MTIIQSLWAWIQWQAIEQGPWMVVVLPPILIVVATLGMRALYREERDRQWLKRNRKR